MSEDENEGVELGSLEGRVVVVTGAGRGLGRAHALLLAREGAHVVVNDLGTALDGRGANAGPAHDVVAEILAAGGRAVADTSDVADWHGARALIEVATESFGRLDVVVNNAGILRNGPLVDMAIEDWDQVVAVHLRATFATTHWAAQHWRTRHAVEGPVDGSIINTASISGLRGIPEQGNYGAAKGGILTFTLVAARELGDFGVRVNAICPLADTRIRGSRDGVPEADPADVSPLVAALAAPGSGVTGQVYSVARGVVRPCQPWTELDPVEPGEGGWSVPALVAELERLA